MTNMLERRQGDGPGVVSDAASTVVDRASEVGAGIGEQTRNVAQDARAHARQMVDESRESLRAEASSQATRLASTLRDVGGQLRSMAQSQSGGGVAVDVSRQLSDAAHRVAEKLEVGGVDDVLADVKRFARRRPGLFLLGAAGAGFAAGRLLKAADTQSLMEAARDSDEDADVPLPPVAGRPSLGIAEVVQ